MSILLLCIGIVRVAVFFLGAFAEAEEYEEVAKVHGSQYQDDDANFGTEKFDQLGVAVDQGAGFQGQGDVAEVDQVKSDQKQLVHGIGKGIVAFENIDQKYAAILKENFCDPNCKADADEQVGEVSDSF